MATNPAGITVTHNIFYSEVRGSAEVGGSAVVGGSNSWPLTPAEDSIALHLTHQFTVQDGVEEAEGLHEDP